MTQEREQGISNAKKKYRKSDQRDENAVLSERDKVAERYKTKQSAYCLYTLMCSTVYRN